MSSDETLMYLIRHGATANNEAGVLQGRGVDHSLCALGRRQIDQTASLMASKPVTAVYASPLRRAVESADIVASRLGLSVEIVEGLVEVDVGRWEGLSWNQIAQSDAPAYQRFVDESGRCGYPDGESYQQVAERVGPLFAELLAQHGGRQFAVVAHSVVNRVYLANLLRLPSDHARQISQTNGCINVIRRRADSTRVLTINAAIHVA